MIYKIKTWKFIPVVSEVFISAKTDEECLKTFEDIKPKIILIINKK